MKENVFHICTEESWNRQLDQKDITHASLASEGFIHCSTIKQLSGVLQRYFKDQAKLVFLELSPMLISSKLIYEASTGGELFPHIYGPINRNAIVKVHRELPLV